jgi:putative ABC transport system permease protein
MRWFADLAYDVRHGLRRIRKSPLVSIATILTLALGIGLDAGVFTLVDGMVFRARVSEDPDSFVQLDVASTGAGSRVAGLPFVSVRDYEAFRTGAASSHHWIPASPPTRER